MLVLDVETTILNKGNPFDYRNRLCYLGFYDGSTYELFDIHYGSEVNQQNLGFARDIIADHDLLIGFNIKFDLHYLKRYHVNFEHCSVWDAQLVHFILSNQSTPYPSLDGVADFYKLGRKLDVVDRDYWSRGLDTTEVPRDILEEYLSRDLYLTYQVYLKQLEEIDSE